MILERDVELALLDSLVTNLDSSDGRVVLVRGEAGIGKSTLINRCLEEWRDRAHTLLGVCDDLLTPQPLGPLWDIAREEPSLVDRLAEGNRRATMDAVLDLLSRSLRPTILVIEDTQWADEATLDLIKFLGRRIARTNALLILTYRDTEVDAAHPLRQVISDLPPQGLVRMSLSSLSLDAIASMDVDGSFDVDEVHALTGGNPLFVTEVLASGASGVPSSVTDAVLARASKLSPQARRVLDLISVVPGDVDRTLVDDIIGASDEELSECARNGLLAIDGSILSIPHDLQRRAIESSLTSADRRGLNASVLTALKDSTDFARLVHHANEAQDFEAIVRFAPLAARAALEIESTTEAVSHFRTLEPLLDRFDIEERATILTDWGTGEHILGTPGSVTLLDRAINLYRRSGDRQALARTLTLAARANATYSRPEQAVTYAEEAIVILNEFGASADLARAFGYRAFLAFYYQDRDEFVLPFVEQALSMATEVDDVESALHALNTKGHLLHSRGDSNGMRIMEETLSRCVATGDHRGEVRALSNMAGMYGDVRDIERATDFGRRAIDTAARYEIRGLEIGAQAMYSEFLLWKGDWEVAEDLALGLVSPAQHVEALATRVLGTIQARRGRKDARRAILHMWALVQEDEGATIVDPAAAAVAEYLWLSGEDAPDLEEELQSVLESGIALGRPWPSGAFVFWMWKLGLLETVPGRTADFYGWIIKGEYTRSVAYWRDRGIPYEEGLALMHGNETEQIEAIRIFETLGATATANKVRTALSAEGIKVPRGKSQATRDHVAGLTARQAEVLALLARDLTNSQIADELFVSHRTAENHVSAVLMKLDVPNRDAAVAFAVAEGILPSL